MQNKHIFVTGGAGFIGSHLTERLCADGADVTVVDNCSNGQAEWVPDDAAFFERDLTERDALDNILTE